MLREYYRLAKPGIIYGNVMTTLAAFLYASRWQFPPVFLIETLLGIGFVIASACVFNNYFDRELDVKMERTKRRALATGTIPILNALIYASVLGIVGFALLALQVNPLTALVALLGFVFYVLLYTFSKRSSPLGTIVGSVSGAVPIVVGYTAVANRLDITALILFLILVVWQMPHFYAIAIRRLEEYRAANVPVLPLMRGIRTTKLHMLAYIVAYLVATSALTLLGRAGYVYLAIVLLSGIAWLIVAIAGFSAQDDRAWAKRLFFFSLAILLSFSVALALGSVLP